MLSHNNRIISRLIIIRFLIATLSIVAATGCAPHTAKERTVTVSTESQRWLLEQIVGDRLTVVSLMDKGADPENFDPSIKTLRTLENGKAYFMMGHNAFEKATVDRLPNEIVVIDCSEGIKLLQGSHCEEIHDHANHNHADEANDPHIMTSLVNAQKVAANMTRGLEKIDPDGSSYYRHNLAKLTAKLDSLNGIAANCLSHNIGAGFLVTHPSLSYFAHDYGLRQIALGSEGKESSPGAIARRIEAARKAGATVMVVQPHDEASRTAAIAYEAGADTICINTNAYTWVDNLMRLVKSLDLSKPQK